ncbi:type II secretion system protein [Microaceticoccus formicicus]|uniref:type II secretion system protein n=1 Tax=Microaceticoccus formicicus TaxID=3118105 RepID=UPI003CCFF655|nr:type II secretion system protein [Peptoniphilaceae bacterium AMB_02]
MKRPAFTLLEAIIALSILAIVVVYLLPAIYINHNKRNDKSNDIKNAYYAQAIMENFKSKHFTGIDTKLNIPEDLEYQVEEEVSGRFTIVEVRIIDDEKEFKTKLALPNEKGIYAN